MQKLRNTFTFCTIRHVLILIIMYRMPNKKLLNCEFIWFFFQWLIDWHLLVYLDLTSLPFLLHLPRWSQWSVIKSRRWRFVEQILCFSFMLALFVIVSQDICYVYVILSLFWGMHWVCSEANAYLLAQSDIIVHLCPSHKNTSNWDIIRDVWN